MKRVLVLLSLVAAFFVASACTYETNLSVTASAELTYLNGAPVHVGPQLYEGYHQRYLTDYDLEEIFLDLTKNSNLNFDVAYLYLEIFDEIGRKPLRNETYGVVYNSQDHRFEFADMDVIY